MRDHPLLEDPAWHSLGGPHEALGERHGPLRRYHADFAPFAAAETPEALAGLAAILPQGAGAVFLIPRAVAPPEGLETVMVGEGLQMVAEEPRLTPATAAMRALGPADVPAITELVELTQPGPFSRRTIEMGRYLGVFDRDRLVAVTGERMRPPGYTEVSAVCTHPAYRGRGLGRQLVSAVCEAIVARGETPFLHVRADNAEAVGLYESLGFHIRTPVRFTVLKHAGAAEDGLPSYLRGHASR